MFIQAFISEPQENDYVSNPVVMAKVEEMFDVLKLNGNQYRHSHVTGCNHDDKSLKITLPYSNISLVKDCYQYSEFAYSKKRTLLYTARSKDQTTPSDIDVSVVTQLTFDRVHTLEQFASSWLGPMVVVLYLTDMEAFKLKTLLKESSVFQRRTNIDLHLVFKRKVR